MSIVIENGRKWEREYNEGRIVLKALHVVSLSVFFLSLLNEK